MSRLHNFLKYKKYNSKLSLLRSIVAMIKERKENQETHILFQLQNFNAGHCHRCTIVPVVSPGQGFFINFIFTGQCQSVLLSAGNQHINGLIYPERGIICLRQMMHQMENGCFCLELERPFTNIRLIRIICLDNLSR